MQNSIAGMGAQPGLREKHRRGEERRLT